jgi:hypothetical protein
VDLARNRGLGTRNLTSQHFLASWATPGGSDQNTAKWLLGHSLLKIAAMALAPAEDFMKAIPRASTSRSLGTHRYGERRPSCVCRELLSPAILQTRAT